MPRKITLFILFLVLIFLPQVAIQAKTIDDNLTFVRVNEIINSSLFTVSDSVIIDGQINGDLIALSKNISVNGQISGDIIALTEEITINGQVDGNIRVFGSVINLNGPVARNVTVLANQVNLKTDSKISWDAYIASYNLENNGQIEGELKSYIFKNKGAKKTNLWLYLWPFIFKLFCALIVGLVLIFIGRGFLPKISKALEKNPWRSLAPGALICFLSPFVVLFLGLTLIGLPLALIILALWIILIYLAKIFIALFIGQLILTKINKKLIANLLWPLLLGLLIVYLLLAIPYFGAFFSLIFSLVGLGAFYLYASNQPRNL